jgi:hypothetical protein
VEGPDPKPDLSTSLLNSLREDNKRQENGIKQLQFLLAENNTPLSTGTTVSPKEETMGSWESHPQIRNSSRIPHHCLPIEVLFMILSK